MRTLPQALITELSGGVNEANFLVYIVDIETITAKYLTNADQKIYYEGKTYEPWGMNFGAVEYSISPTVDKVSVEVDNVDLTFSSMLQTEEMRGKRFLIRLAALNQNMGVVGAVIHFDGILDSIRAKKKIVKIDVYNHMILWKKKIPRRTHQPTCTWTFKDSSTCKYTGATATCDKSWDECVAMSNSINFGGFRFLPSLSDKQIWWGSVPK